jgi:tRNA (cytidine/uridine-2'-O-)-methyltransferase
MFHVLLLEPEIPPNTGNVIRLCANTGAVLHLIKPLGFRIDAKSVRRSGLDYRDLVDVRVHENFAAARQALGNARIFAVETGAARCYAELAYRPGDVFLFGPETRGLPAAVLANWPREQWVSIPMQTESRSLNLSNCVALIVYEAWRQNGFSRSAPSGAPSRRAPRHLPLRPPAP